MYATNVVLLLWCNNANRITWNLKYFYEWKQNHKPSKQIKALSNEKKPSSFPSRPLVMRHQQASFGPTYGKAVFGYICVFCRALCNHIAYSVLLTWMRTSMSSKTMVGSSNVSDVKALWKKAVQLRKGISLASCDTLKGFNLLMSIPVLVKLVMLLMASSNLMTSDRYFLSSWCLSKRLLRSFKLMSFSPFRPVSPANSL